MVLGDYNGVGRNQKRKSPEKCEDGDSRFCLDELNQDMLERVLSWLPTSTFFRTRSVCKRWKSVENSATFNLACSEVPSREPWFYMVDAQIHLKSQPIVYDSAENNWTKINHLSSCSNFIPVAASGSLICFQSAPDKFVVCNPITGSCRQIAYHWKNEQMCAIGMISRANSYKLVLVSGESPTLSLRVYNSGTDSWGENVVLNRKISYPSESSTNDDNTLYYLSKCGNVFSSNLQRTPCKQYSSVIVQKDGAETMYFLSSTGAVIVCNLANRSYYEYPRLLPVYCEYSIDLVECGGEVYVIMLSELLESASLRVWKYDETARSWHQISAMPPAMSNEFYGKNMDINCSAAGDQILVCLSSPELFQYFSCNLAANKWVELPPCSIDSKAKRFVSAISFEPRIETAV